jgi:hypothetical protein
MSQTDLSRLQILVRSTSTTDVEPFQNEGESNGWNRRDDDPPVYSFS